MDFFHRRRSWPRADAGRGSGGCDPQEPPRAARAKLAWNERRAQAHIELARRQPRTAARGRGMPAASRRNARPRPLRRLRARAQLCDVTSSLCARYREAATIARERTPSLQRRHYARVDACRAHQFGWDLTALVRRRRRRSPRQRRALARSTDAPSADAGSA